MYPGRGRYEDTQKNTAENQRFIKSVHPDGSNDIHGAVNADKTQGGQHPEVRILEHVPERKALILPGYTGVRMEGRRCIESGTCISGMKAQEISFKILFSLEVSAMKSQRQD